MDCPRCGSATRTKKAVVTHGFKAIRRVRICVSGHRSTTYEIDEKAWKAGRYDIRRSLERQDYNREIEARRVQKEMMLAERMAGVSCPELAKKYDMSVHMARYYTRLPRAKLYPSVKNKESLHGASTQGG